MGDPSTSPTKWFILHFENLCGNRDILYMSDTNQSIEEAAKALEETIIQEFARGDQYTAHYSLELDSNPMQVVVTLSQLVTFLRSVPEQSQKPMIPDLLGFGSNTVTVHFRSARDSYSGF
jgi:hypothetical protein